MLAHFKTAKTVYIRIKQAPVSFHLNTGQKVTGFKLQISGSDVVQMPLIPT